MLHFIKNIIPLHFKKVYWRHLKKQERARKKRVSFNGKTPKEAFTFIYNTNHWSGSDSISGGGSDLQHTKIVISSINKLIEELDLKSILDVPCGDFAWMQYVNLKGATYIGGDIVEDLIKQNVNRFKEKAHVDFQVIDLTHDTLPKSDILFVRDCLVHLSFKDIGKALQNIKKSGCKYLLTTTFTDHKKNTDITTGDWRALNLQEAPFHFRDPIILINEEYNHPDYRDKSLGLWKIDDIVLTT